MSNDYLVAKYVNREVTEAFEKMDEKEVKNEVFNT